MTFSTRTFLAAALCVVATHASAQSSAATDASRQDAVVQQAMQTYQRGLAGINATAAQPGAASGAWRELRLEEAVAIALEKNLDIQVARLEPQSVDLLVAGFRNTYRPLASSTVGRRDQYQLPPAASTAAPR